MAEPGSEDAAHLLKQSADRLTSGQFLPRCFFWRREARELSLVDAGMLVAGPFADSKSTLVWRQR